MLKPLLPALLTAGLACGAIRPTPAAPTPCTPAERTHQVLSAGLVFVGPSWLGEYLLVTQAPRTLAGMSAPVRIGLRRSLASRLWPETLTRPDLTTGNAYSVNPEALLLRHPAVAIQAPFAPRLAAMGLCTAALLANYGAPDSLAEQTRVFAGLAGEPARADELLRHFDMEVDRLAAALAALPDPGRPRVLILGMSKYGQIYAQGGRHPASRAIARAGGVSALADVPTLGVRLDAERLLRLDPDHVFLAQALAEETPSRDALRHTPLGALRAVRDDHVYPMPQSWTTFDSVVEIPAYERWIAEKLHPGLPRQARDDLRQAYARELGVALPERWVDDALSVAR